MTQILKLKLKKFGLILLSIDLWKETINKLKIKNQRLKNSRWFFTNNFHSIFSITTFNALSIDSKFSNPDSIFPKGTNPLEVLKSFVKNAKFPQGE